MSIRMIDLPAEYLQIEKELLPAITAVLKSGSYIQGNIVKTFENQLAAYLNVKHVISCGNGTDALQIALMALGIKAGDEVILPAFSYIAVAEVVCLLGATPVFVDVDDTYFQLNPIEVKKHITPRTKAIIPVHLFGQSANLEHILELAAQNNIKVVEDCAQSLGGKYEINGKQEFLGTIGNFGCTSFFPTKNLSCFGDGGALFTNDDELATKARMIANHGQKEKYNHQLVGINSRLDSLQAAILTIKLANLTKLLNQKSTLAKQYLDNLNHISNVGLPQTHPKSSNSWHQFTIKVKKGLRDQLRAELKSVGTESMIYYPMPIPQQPAYQQFNENYPVAEQLSEEVLSLPIHPLLDTSDIDYICLKLYEFFNARI
ncbi:MAG TPA: DegT/DnrJ/EryC1/StrS family aminotransferase [Pelobium sp.]